MWMAHAHLSFYIFIVRADPVSSSANGPVLSHFHSRCVPLVALSIPPRISSYPKRLELPSTLPNAFRSPIWPFGHPTDVSPSPATRVCLPAHLVSITPPRAGYKDVRQQPVHACSPPIHTIQVLHAGLQDDAVPETFTITHVDRDGVLFPM